MIHTEFTWYTTFISAGIHIWKVCFTDASEKQLIVYYMITDEYIKFARRVKDVIPDAEYHDYPIHGNHSPALEHNTRAFVEGLIRTQKSIIDKYFKDHEFNSKEIFVGFATEQEGYDRWHHFVTQKYPNLALAEHTGMWQDEEVRILGKIQ